MESLPSASAERWKLWANSRASKAGESKKPQKVAPLLINKEKFDKYIDLHKSKLQNPQVMEPECNTLMLGSYILIDEHGCHFFLDCSTGGKVPTSSVFKVGLEEAARDLLSSKGGGFDRESYFRRGGYYPEKWSACKWSSRNFHGASEVIWMYGVNYFDKFTRPFDLLANG